MLDFACTYIIILNIIHSMVQCYFIVNLTGLLTVLPYVPIFVNMV